MPVHEIKTVELSYGDEATESQWVHRAHARFGSLLHAGMEADRSSESICVRSRIGVADQGKAMRSATTSLR